MDALDALTLDALREEEELDPLDGLTLDALTELADRLDALTLLPELELELDS